MPAAFSNTAGNVIADAYVDAGLLSIGDTPNSDQLADGLRRLCDIINFEQTQGVKLFTLDTISVNLVASTQSYTVTQPSTTPPDQHVQVIDARIEDTDGNSLPLTELSRSDWNRLSNKTTEGAVIQFYMERQYNSLTVKFWNVPDTTEALKTVYLTVRKQITNPRSLTEDLQFPAEWRIFLRWALANEICTGQPDAIVRRCEKNYVVYKEALEGFDVENATVRFTVDTQGRAGGEFV